MPGHPDDMLRRRELGEDFAELFPAVAFLAAEPVARRGDHDLRVQLGEPRNDCSGAEFRCADGPDGPDRGGSEEPRHRLGHVGKDSNDPVPGANALVAQVLRERGDLAPQRVPADLFPGPVLGDGDERCPVMSFEQVAGEVQGAAGEPSRVRHGIRCADRPLGAAELHARKLGEELPERLWMID